MRHAAPCDALFILRKGNTMTGFAALGLPETLLKALHKIGFDTPTPIQKDAVPPALQGRDVLGSAATGTGKTAAFALPLINHLINKPDSKALIMTPTRELAMQVLATIQPLLLMHKEIAAACLIGGEAMGRQMAQLSRKPRLIVGTPGRLNDHLTRRSLKLDKADFLVLDETDRMLDMGFGVQIEKVIAHMAGTRQTLMFSATLPPAIVKLSAKYLVNPVRVSVGQSNKPAAAIRQELVRTSEADKYTQLLAQLEARKGSVIVFVKTKYGADRLAIKLSKADYQADALHGNLQQRRRERVIQNFRDKKYRILVATDVAARGLDIPHIEHVINYDLPQAPEDYIHRIGRTARAGAEGEAVNLVTPADADKWRAILRLIDPASAAATRHEPRAPHGKKGDAPRGKSRFNRHKKKDGAKRDGFKPRGTGKPRQGKKD